MSAHDTTLAAGIGEGRNDQVGAGSLASLPDAPDTLPLTSPEVARCRCCSHPITAARSVARGVGPECWRRLTDALARATGGRFAVVLDVDAGAVIARLEPTGAER